MGDKKKVLVVDDEVSICNLVKTALAGEEDIEVIFTNNALEAEKMVMDENPDLILLDVVMPDKNGSVIAKELKANKKTKNIPIIIMTGLGEMVYNENSDQWKWMPNNPLVRNRGEVIDEKIPWKAAEAYGVEDFISKPFEIDTLLDVIKECLEKYKRKDNGPASI